MDWARLIGSRAFFLVGLFGLVVAGVLAIGVPQGSSDAEVLSSHPLSTGPFILLFGLHHAGRSFALWAVLVALSLHVGARVLVRRERSEDVKEGVFGPSRWSLYISMTLVLASLAGLVWSGEVETPPRTPDPSRLRVRVADAPGGPTTQTVEEGAMYEVPGAHGPRTLLFGVASGGPYAIEQTYDGHSRVHLPGFADEARPSTVAIEARRPAASEVPDFGRIPPMPRPLGLACLGMVALALVAIAGRWMALAADDFRQVSWLGASFLALLVFNPLAGPGRARTPLQAATGGGDVAWSTLVTTPGDVAPWSSLFPATVRMDGAWWLSLACGAGAVLLVLAILSARPDRKLPTPTRALAGVCAGLAALTGITWVAHSAGRIPAVSNSSDLLRVFETEVLPRIPMDVPVLRVEVTSPGPYFVPGAVGLGTAIVSFASALVFARVARGRSGRTGPGGTVATMAWWMVLGVAVLRSAWISGSVATDGATPFSLIALLVAALVPLVARGHSDWPAGGLVTTMAAATMQFAIPV